jgi:hypothetical protein
MKSDPGTAGVSSLPLPAEVSREPGGTDLPKPGGESELDDDDAAAKDGVNELSEDIGEDISGAAGNLRAPLDTVGGEGSRNKAVCEVGKETSADGYFIRTNDNSSHNSPQKQNPVLHKVKDRSQKPVLHKVKD